MNKKNVAIVDVGCSNLGSMYQAIKAAGFEIQSITDPKQFKRHSSDAVILPGSGNARTLARSINETGFRDLFIDLHDSFFPILGVCSGMHVLFEGTDEEADNEGSVGVDSCLGLFPGKVEKIFDGQKNINVGWHRPNFANEGALNTWAGAEIDKNFFFMHGFGASVNEHSISTSCFVELSGGHKILAAMRKKNTVGVQFHPEKSGNQGLGFLKQIIEVLAISTR